MDNPQTTNKITENMSHGRRRLNLNSNQASAEYKSGGLRLSQPKAYVYWTAHHLDR